MARGWFSWLLGYVSEDQEHECMYGKTAGALGDCTIVVPPLQGWRHNGMVFCSEEHARLDQEEQLF